MVQRESRPPAPSGSGPSQGPGEVPGWGAAEQGTVPLPAAAELSFGGAAALPGAAGVPTDSLPWAHGFTSQWQDNADALDLDPRIHASGSRSRSTSPSYGFRSGRSQVLQIEHQPYIPSPGTGLGRRFWSPPHAEGPWSPPRWHRPLSAAPQGAGSPLPTGAHGSPRPYRSDRLFYPYDAPYATYEASATAFRQPPTRDGGESSIPSSVTTDHRLGWVRRPLPKHQYGPSPGMS